MGGQPAPRPTAGPSFEEFMTVMQEKNPDKSVEELTKYYKENYA